MKLLFYAHAYPGFRNSGGEFSFHSFAKAMRDRGHEVRVASENKQPYTIDGILVESLHRVDRSDLVKWSDIVLTQLNHAKEASRLARGLRKPIVHFLHGKDSARVFDARAETTSLVVYNSESLKRQSPTDAESIVIYPPVDPDDYRVSVSGDCITLINAAQHKGGDLFFMIARMMPDKNFLAVRGAYGRQLETQLPNLTMLDNTSDVRSVYERTRLLLLPSEHETWGRVAIEAAASGIPTIASDLPGPREALGEAGEFVSDRSAEAWVKAIRRFDDLSFYAKKSKLSLERSEELRPDEDYDRLEDKLLKLRFGEELFVPMLVKVKARIRMSHPGQNRLVAPGEVFEVQEWIANELVERELGTRVTSDEDKALRSYEKAVMPPTDSSEGSSTLEGVEGPQNGSEELTVVEQRGSWYYFSDGEKANGEIAAAKYLGVSRKELNELTDDN